MKKITLIILSLALLVSCAKEGSDLLDPATTVITEEQVFTSAQYTTLFLNDIYGDILPVLPQTGNKGMRWPGTDAMQEITTDNGSTNLSTTGVFFTFNSGAWTAATNTFSTADWSNHWSSIRSCNMFLTRIDNVPLDSEFGFDASIRNVRKGEALFLLAFNYSELIKQFGGLPIIDKPVALSDDMKLPRSTFDATIEFVTGLCDQAATLLPLVHPDADYGRATKGAALALKARLLLYAASPLWNNQSKPIDSPFRGKFDAGKWKKAAQAAKSVIDMNLYELHRTNPELIFVHMNQPCSYITGISVPVKLYPPGGYGKSGCNQVTYNMIKEYEVLKSGKAYMLEDPASGHNYADPYKNRDPRFYRDCMFNGYKFQNKTAEFGISASGGKIPAHNPSEASSYYTHVYSIKFADLTLVVNFDCRNPAAGPRAHHNYAYIRYAEILMNYAEAMNEAFGPEVDGLGNGKTALWAVNQVRTRSQYPARPEYLGQTGGMPPIESGLSKEQLREKIRHERRVEFSFEEHRFDIKAEIPIWQANGSVVYEIRTIDSRVFDRKMYRMPIPEAQLYANPNLVQNPGWSYSPEDAD